MALLEISRVHVSAALSSIVTHELRSQGLQNAISGKRAAEEATEQKPRKRAKEARTPVDSFSPKEELPKAKQKTEVGVAQVLGII